MGGHDRRHNATTRRIRNPRPDVERYEYPGQGPNLLSKAVGLIVLLGLASLGVTALGVPILESWKWVCGGALALVTARVLYTTGRSIYDDIYARRMERKFDRIELARAEQENELAQVRTIEADANGRFPLLYAATGLLKDPNNQRVFTLEDIRRMEPELERIDAVIRLAMAAGRWPGQKAAEQLASQANDEDRWPTRIGLQELLEGRQPSLDHLILGCTLDGDVVGDSIHNLMHTLLAGASGWGKSAELRAILHQVALAQEPCEVIAIDIAGTEFNPMINWPKLRYPVAKTHEEAVAVLEAVSEEIERRKRLFEQHPLATNLREYNQIAAEPLAVWIVVIDEGTYLLHKDGTAGPLRDAVQRARQYGIYIILAGQSVKAKVLDTEVRESMRTRVAFKMSPHSSRALLDSGVAGQISAKGRAYAQLIGKDLIEIQAPWVDRAAFAAAVAGSGPMYPMPAVMAAEAERDAQILALHRAGASARQIEIAVFGYDGGQAHRIVQEVLGTTTTLVDLEETG